MGCGGAAERGGGMLSPAAKGEAEALSLSPKYVPRVLQQVNQVSRGRKQHERKRERERQGEARRGKEKKRKREKREAERRLSLKRGSGGIEPLGR